MEIDFRKIEVTDIEGNKSTFDISKELGNTIYKNTLTWVNWILRRQSTNREK